MDPNLRRLGVGAAIRTLGAAIYNPFVALFLVNVLHLPYVEVGGIIAAIALGLLPFNVLGGLLTDRLGRRGLVLLGLFGEAVATGALALAFWERSLPGAILAAFAGGILTTLAGPATSAYIADVTIGSERTRGFTFFRVGFNAGFSVGVALGGFLVASIGFAESVAVAAAVILGGAVFIALTLDPSPLDRALGVGRSRAPDPGDPRPAPAPPSMGESFRKLLHDRVALEVLLAIAFGGLVVGQWSVTFPLYVHNDLGISYTLLGFGLALNGLVVVFGQTFTTERAIGHRHTSLAILGVALYVVAFVGLGAAGLFLFAPTLVFFLAVVVLTFGENLASIPSSTLPSNLAPAGEVGAYNGAFAAVGAIAFSAAVVLGGSVLTLTANPLLVWVYLVLPAVPAVVLFRHVAGQLPTSKGRA